MGLCRPLVFINRIKQMRPASLKLQNLQLNPQLKLCPPHLNILIKKMSVDVCIKGTLFESVMTTETSRNGSVHSRLKLHPEAPASAAMHTGLKQVLLLFRI